jgi:hypothetical protein
VTNPNPFAAPAPEQAQQQYAPQQPAPAAPQQQPNPFGPGVQQQAPAPAAPQAYAPAPQQQYAAPAQQQYAPPPAAPAPQQSAPAGQYNGPALDLSGLRSADAPPPVGDGNGAKLADMYGRLVLVFPHTVETRNRNPQYITAEQRQQGRLTEELVTATVVVLDMGPGTSPSGGYIDFGGAPHELPSRPHTERAPLPYVRKAMWITQSRLVAQLKPFLPQSTGGTQGMAAGRLTKAGPERNSPWYLEGATEPELALCRTYMGLVTQGQYPHPLA